MPKVIKVPKRPQRPQPVTQIKAVDYRLKGIDPELWKRVRMRALYEGRSVREVMLELLRAYVAQPLSREARDDQSHD